MQTKQEKDLPPFNLKWLAEKFNFKESDVISTQWFALMFEITFKTEATLVAQAFSKKLGAINCPSNWYPFNNSVLINPNHKERLLQSQLKPETNIVQEEIDSLLHSDPIQVNSSTFAPIFLPGKKCPPIMKH